jgi:hypothetical protein
MSKAAVSVSPLPGSAGQPVSRRRAFLQAAVVATVLAVVGFWRTYFGPLAAGAVQQPTVIHIHAVVMVTWLIAQRALFGPLRDLVFFTPFLAAGWIYRRRPEIHKRVMLVATTLLLGPAVGRMFFWGSPSLFGSSCWSGRCPCISRWFTTFARSAWSSGVCDWHGGDADDAARAAIEQFGCLAGVGRSHHRVLRNAGGARMMDGPFFERDPGRHSDFLG